MKLLEILNTGRVLRYHSAPIHRKQRLDSHHWEVAMILLEIYPECSQALMFKALTHDCAEAFTGDLPAPIKNQFPEIRDALKKLEAQYEKELGIIYLELEEEELLAVKHADVLSGMWFTWQQIRAGDQDARCIATKWSAYYRDLPYLNDASWQLAKEIKSYVCKR